MINEKLAKLEDIGFYTLSEERARTCSPTSPMQRCELIVTDICNFKCPYCRGLRDGCKGHMPVDQALTTLAYWCDEGLQNVRFSGGEPTLWPDLVTAVVYARFNGVKRIAISTNGSAPIAQYEELMEAGVNDFSISLDSCCSSVVDQLTGRLGQLAHILKVIEHLAKRTYVTLGVVLTDENQGEMKNILDRARELGVADVRVIPAAQHRPQLKTSDGIVPDNRWPILHYRAANIADGLPVRGLRATDSPRCRLALDDSVVAGKWHFPCVIHMREGGAPIGKVHKGMRRDRARWVTTHNSLYDRICTENCLDVCREYNNRAAKYAKEGAE